MDRRLSLLVVCGGLATVLPIQAQTPEDLRLECKRTAFERYSIAIIAILDSHPRDRRLQQQQLQKVYCATLARCAVIGIGRDSAAGAYSAALSSCLKEEAREFQGYEDDE